LGVNLGWGTSVFPEAGLLWIVYTIVIREDNRRREVVRSLRAAQTGDTTAEPQK